MSRIPSKEAQLPLPLGQPAEPESQTNFEAVGSFMRIMEQEVFEVPKFPDEAITRLRQALIEEEYDEFLEAVLNKDLVGIADALTDILYVVYGAGHAYGIDLDACFREVHASNMTKIEADGTVTKSKAGKVIKPASYRPPDLKAVLEEQRARNSAK